ncbi:MAG: recombinase family protein [Clostridia bacterium]|nr:recombinase family protein [Clostridia bacterium]
MESACQGYQRISETGHRRRRIARILSERKIPNPTAYWLDKGINRGGKKMPKDPHLWKCVTVGKILSNQEYCGDVINFKT